MRNVSRLIFAALGVLAIAIAANVLSLGPRGQNGANPTPAPKRSEDRAEQAAVRIIGLAAQGATGQPSIRMDAVLTGINHTLGSNVFAGAKSAGPQVLEVSVNASVWSALSNSDQNALAAAIASTWAALWQRAHPRDSLHEGPIVRILDRDGTEIRTHVFERPR